jgi:hypothetical protein
MRFRSRLLSFGAAAVAALVVPVVALADHATRESENMNALGHSPHPASFFGQPDGVRHINSDIAFWGKLAFNGNYNGWRVIDVSDPKNPVELAHPECNGDQGDIVVWQNILVRSWNSKKATERTCLGHTVPVRWEGVHVFDISDPMHPQLEKALELPCGSHTLTVAGISNGNLIVYSNNSSSSGCTLPDRVALPRADEDALGKFMDVIAVPLDDPSGASLINRVELVGPADPTVRTGCHDAGVIRGSVNLAVCASSDTTNVFSIGAPRGGSPERPKFLYTIQEPGVDGHVGRWHSASLTWDGKVIVLGWEPGGGGTAECQETSPIVRKSMFFYDAAMGTKLGQWTLPRAQSAEENCTIHNYNIVPISGRYVAVSGNYQAGTWVTDFTNPADPQTVAFSDPPPLGQVTTPAGAVVNELGGAWSSYWYNDVLYESEITKGLNLFNLGDPEVTAGAIRLDHLNPQTQEFSLP